MSVQLTQGYKQTEVGVIPEDWSTTKLGNHASFRTGPFGSALHKSDYVDDGVPVINPMQIVGGKIRPTASMAITEPAARTLAEFRLAEGNIVIGRRGDMGRCALVGKKEDGWLCGTGSMIVRTNKSLDAAFLQRILSSPAVIAAIENTSVGSTMINLNQGTLKNLVISLPPTKAEQEAIAEALSDADSLIESLEQLLAKKRHLKQGTMQELLTGKKRLPGFQVNTGYKKSEVGVIPMDWNVKLLADVCKFRGGKAHEQYVSEFGEYICVNSKFISTEGLVKKHTTANFCCANKNDVLMVMSDLPNGKALAKAYLTNRDNCYAVNQRVCALTAYYDCPKYLYYILNRNPYFLKFDNGVSQTHLLNNVFAACPIPLPPTKAEQEQIAAALSDIDAEIADLEAQLDKTRVLKQGMMHKLLTGEIRLL